MTTDKPARTPQPSDLPSAAGSTVSSRGPRPVSRHHTVPTVASTGPYRDSISEWLQHARRAGDLVSRLELAPAPRQNAVERDRLGEISAALAHLRRAGD